MAKSKIKQTGGGFVMEGVLNYKDGYIEAEEIGDYPLDKVFKKFEGQLVKITIKEPDIEIFEVPQDDEDEVE